MRLVGRDSREDKQSAANRAEELRQKRGERSQKRVSQATQRAAHPVRVRPVVVRGGAFGTPIHQRAAKKAPRRAFYVTMDSAAGTELRLPALPTFHLSWRIASSLVAALALFGIYTMWDSDLFRVTTVSVQGLERITPDEVNQTLDLGMVSVVEVDQAEIYEKIAKAYPEVIGVRVSVELPNVVAVTASERQPMIAWKKGDQVSWLDEDGVAFPPRGDAGPLITLEAEDDLPLAVPVTATVDESQPADTPASMKAASAVGPVQVQPELVQATKRLSEKLPEKTRLVYSKNNGLGWVDKEGWQVFIGTDLNSFDERYMMYQALVSHLKSQGLTPVLVSVEHMNAPFYRLEP